MTPITAVRSSAEKVFEDSHRVADALPHHHVPGAPEKFVAALQILPGDEDEVVIRGNLLNSALVTGRSRNAGASALVPESAGTTREET